MKYHQTPAGPGPCRATRGRCPYGGPDEHYNTREEAQAAFEEKYKSLELSSHSKSNTLREQLHASGKGQYPKAILNQLSSFLEDKPYKTLVVLPAGSQLYNSAIPGRPVHDYDFTAFVEPHETLKYKPYPHLSGELDVTIVRIDALSDVSRRSTPISEAFLAYKSQRHLAKQESSWDPYLSSLNVPLVRFFDTMDDVMRSQTFTEPALQDDPKNFNNFKHNVRWTLYHRRWGSGGGEDGFDPRLTDEERSLFVEAIEKGSMAPVLESFPKKEEE